MIAKRITRSGGPSSFAKLARYIVAARGDQDPRSWERTTDYILDSAAHGEKVERVSIHNCYSDDPAIATLEIMAVQELNKRSKADKTYHLVISFPPGERPPDDVLDEIEQTLCDTIGLGDHQRISAVHNDTAHLHIHVAINKVNPATYNNIEPFYDHDRLMRACELLEIKYGLQRTHHGERVITRDQQEIHDDEHDYSQRRGRAGPALTDDQAWLLRQSYDRAIASEPEATTLDAVRTLSSCSVGGSTGLFEKLLPDHEAGHLVQRGADADIRLRRPGHESGSPGATPALTAGAANMHAYAGVESFQAWLQGNIAQPLLAARSWGDVHSILHQYDLRVVASGAGLAIVSGDGRDGVRASRVHRELSRANLEKRLGAFAAAAIKPAARPGVVRPLKPTAERAQLFAEYQRQKAAATVARRTGLETLREQWATYSKELAAHHNALRQRIARMRGEQRRGSYALLAQKRKKDWSAKRALHQQQLAQLRASTAMPTWNDWLAEQAVAGNAVALAALRQASNRRRQAPGVGGVGPMVGAMEGVPVVLPEARAVTKAGVASYAVGRATVADGPAGVRVDTVDREAIVVALQLAQQRYGDKPLRVDGSDAFCAAVLSAAAQMNMQVELAWEQGTRPVQGPAKAPQPAADRGRAADAGDALAAYIAERNVTAQRVADLPPHRHWMPGDAGEAVYRGQRRLEDGRTVALLERGQHMLVMPVTPAQAAKLSTVKVGAAVSVDSRSRFISTGSRARGR